MTQAPVRLPRGAPARLLPVLAWTTAGTVVLAVSVAVGSTGFSPAALFDPGHPAHAVYEARLERTALAAAVGAALGLGGSCLQGLTRNPLADPGILGLNAGASLAMVLAISGFGISALQQYIWFAFLGAAATAVGVQAIASLGRDGASPLKLVVAGAAVTAALTSWTSAVLLLDRKTMESFRLWQVGTVGGRGLDVLGVGLPFLLAGVLLVFAGSRTLDALALGDDLAHGLGRRVSRDRLVVGLAVVLLAGTATALAGPIAFVGLVVPHAVRAVAGPGYGRVLPLSAVGGALLTVLADTVGRVVLPPTEVQVGIMAAVVGVPAFFVLLRRGRMAGL